MYYIHVLAAAVVGSAVSEAGGRDGAMECAQAAVEPSAARRHSRQDVCTRTEETSRMVVHRLQHERRVRAELLSCEAWGRECVPRGLLLLVPETLAARSSIALTLHVP